MLVVMPLESIPANWKQFCRMLFEISCWQARQEIHGNCANLNNMFTLTGKRFFDHNKLISILKKIPYQTSYFQPCVTQENAQPAILVNNCCSNDQNSEGTFWSRFILVFDNLTSNHGKVKIRFNVVDQNQFLPEKKACSASQQCHVK